MSDQALLSDLCSICYTQKSKYRCPRCRTQTCSLPCYKRHQQRASCNGKRDPAVFVKRSQLATPAGIDQDYNYLKSVERSIDHAARETSDRGVGGKSNAKGSERGLHPESLLHRYLVSNRITVERAPKGMSRQKSNQTRFTKRQNVLWTVEWIDAAGLQTLQVDCSASSSIRNSYDLMLLQKRNASMRSRAGEGCKTSFAKRKLAGFESDPAKKAPKVERVSKDGEKQANDTGFANDAVRPQRPTQSENDDEALKSAEVERETKPAPDEQLAENAQSVSQSFYLLKPGTSSASKILIPLDSQASLTASLQNQTVLEYPTIYAFHQSPGALPPGYLLELEYNKIRKGEEDELDEAIKQAGAAATVQGAREYESVPAANTPVDPQRILDMLKRDITR